MNKPSFEALQDARFSARGIGGARGLELIIFYVKPLAELSLACNAQGLILFPGGGGGETLLLKR